jgi:alkylation response protein AidB-like acyl-CoA dehydrogenase
MLDHNQLNDEHKELIARCRTFAEEVLAPNAALYDKGELVPYEVIRLAAEAGIYTGEFFTKIAMDPTGLSLVLAAEELAAGDAGLALAVTYPMLPLTALLLAGTVEQQTRLIPEMLGTLSEPLLCSFAASEPGAGSDVAGYRTTAHRDGDHWVIRGVKRWAGNAGVAGTYLVVANIDLELGPRGQAIFAVPADSAGLWFGEKMSKLGLRAVQHADLHLDDVRVPLDAVLGGTEALEKRLTRLRAGEKDGFHPVLATFEVTRPYIAAMAVGVARAAHEHTLEYVKRRETFGKPLIQHQQVAATIADQRTRIDAARLLVWRAASIQARGELMTQGEGSQAKLFAAQVVSDVTSECVRLAGGIGFTDMTPLERMYRDAPIFGIFEGASEVQRLVIASRITGQRIR